VLRRPGLGNRAGRDQPRQHHSGQQLCSMIADLLVGARALRCLCRQPMQVSSLASGDCRESISRAALRQPIL
jgi:hypothetical protein